MNNVAVNTDVQILLIFMDSTSTLFLPVGIAAGMLGVWPRGLGAGGGGEHAQRHAGRRGSRAMRREGRRGSTTRRAQGLLESKAAGTLIPRLHPLARFPFLL